VRGAGKKQEFLDVDAFLERVRGEIASRALVPAVPAGEPPAAAAAAAAATDAAAAV